MAENREKFLQLARERFVLADKAQYKVKTEALDDLRFRCLQQWPEHIRKQREAEGKPCLTLDRLGQFTRQVTNEIRQNRPAIAVGPVDSQGDPDTAEILQGLIRHIEQNSGASQAYHGAAEYAAIMGFGYFRVRADYCDPMSFDQEILIEPIANQFSVFIDPAAVRSDRSDMKYAFIVDRLSKEEFERQYPDAETTSSFSDFSGISDTAPEWFGEDGVQIAEYFRIEYQKVEIALLETGQVIEAKDLREGDVVLKKRKADIPTVKWAKITGIEVLEETDIPGDEIPIFAVLGEEFIVDGERHLAGVIRPAKSAQLQYNYMASAETETIGLASKSPWIIAEGQDEGYEDMWATANVRNYSRLIYKPKTVNNLLAPPPQRNTFEPAIQAISMARMQAAEDMKANTGQYDASLGARSNETSGVAIRARQSEGDTATFHYADNLAKTLTRLGRMLLKWIRVYYDRERVVRIIGEEEDQKTVTINAPTEDKGVPKIYDLTTGKYDVTVSSKPSFSSKRQEAAESMMQLTQAYPQIMQIAGDLLVNNLDWPGAKALAERLKKALPPGLADDDENKQPIPPQAQAQIQQMGQMIEHMTAQLNEQAEEIKTQRIQVDSKERIEMEKLQVQREEIQAKLAIESAKLGSSESITQLQEELNMIRHEMEMQQRELDAQRQAEAAAQQADDMPAAA